MNKFEKIAKTLEKIMFILSRIIAIIGIIMGIYGFINVFFGGTMELFIIGFVVALFGAGIGAIIEYC